MRALLSTACCAVAAVTPPDATQTYIDTLGWPVNVVAPKMHFMAPSAGIAAPYCNLSLMDALERALYLDELEDPQPVLARLRALMGFVSDVFQRVDGYGNKTVPVMPSLPVFQNPRAAPTAKVRELMMSMALALNGSDKFLSAVDEYGAEVDQEKRNYMLDMMIKSKKKRKSRGILAKYVAKVSRATRYYSDDKFMDLIPDTLVGFLSSRVLTELLSELFTDAWGESIVHDVNPTNLSAGICRAFKMGPKNDFLPETTICTLVTLLLTALGCSRDTALVDCSRRTTPKYAFEECDLLPADWRSAPAVDLSFIPVDEAVDNVTRKLTDTGRKHDGPTLYALQLAQLHWGDAAGQRWCEMRPEEPAFRRELLPGWAIVREIWLNQENSAAESNTSVKISPYAVLSKKRLDLETDLEFWTSLKPLAKGGRRLRNKMIGEPEPETEEDSEEVLEDASTTSLGTTADNSTTTLTGSSSSGTTSTSSRAPVEEGTCEFMMINRGTATGWEWFMNLSVAHTILPMLNDPQAKGHLGYAIMAASILQPVIEHLTDEFESGACKPELTTVWFSGHSLGAGQTNMQSLLLAGYWRQRGHALKVNAFGEASMRLFNERATALHKEWVNMRNLVFEYDFVPGMGCLGTGLPRCNPKYWRATIHGEGSDEPEQPLGGEIFLRGAADFTHAPLLPGETTNVTETLSFFDDRRFTFLPAGEPLALVTLAKQMYLNIPASMQVGMAHVCSYHCYTSRNFCSVYPEKQIACVREPLYLDQPKSCMNDTLTRPDMAGTTNAKLSSLDCTPEFWGYDNLDNYNASNPEPYYCTGIIPGLNSASIEELLGSLTSRDKAEL